MTTEEKLLQVSLPGEKWKQIAEHPDYWSSNLHRVASAKVWGSPVRLIRVNFNMKNNRYYFVASEYSQKMNVYLDEEPQKIETFDAVKDRRKKADALKSAEYWAEQLLGTTDHPDFAQKVDTFYQIALM